MARWQGDELRIELSRITEAHVRVVGGEVAVTASEGPARLEADVVAGNPLRVTVDDGVLTVIHEPQGVLRNIGAAARMQAIVVLTVPPGTPVTVRTVSADVVAAGLRRGAGLTTVSGGITVTDIAGDLGLRSVSGDIEAEMVDGDLTVNVVSGSVIATGRVPVLSARAISGDLTFDVTVAPEASLSTVSGEVVLRIPSDARCKVDLTTMSGSLDSAFPVDGASSRRRLTGTVGDPGGPEIGARTVSGDIAILRNPAPAAMVAAGDDR